jgi:hypothetical protein
MRLLTKGREQKGWAAPMVCIVDDAGGCGAELLVEEADITCVMQRDYTGSSEGYYCWFECTECGCETDCTEELPSSVQERREKR